MEIKELIAIVEERYNQSRTILSSMEYKPTYNPKYRDAADVTLIKTVIEHKGLAFAIASMIEGSLGYHSARSASLAINAVVNGEIYGCERTTAVFRDDLVLEIIHDLYFALTLESTRKRVEQLEKVVPQLLGLSTTDAMTLSCLYPTM